MDHRLADIAAALSAEAEGDGTIRVRGAAEPGQAGPDDLALALSPMWIEDIARGAARAALLPVGTD